jgi:anaphase-promoting complex subunit 13
MGGLEQEQGLSLGILIDIVDEQWMRDTLPAEGACRLPSHFLPFLAICPLTALTPAALIAADIPVPPAMAVKTEDAEDPASASTLAFSTSACLPTYQIISYSVRCVTVSSGFDLHVEVAERRILGARGQMPNSDSKVWVGRAIAVVTNCSGMLNHGLLAKLQAEVNTEQGTECNNSLHFPRLKDIVILSYLSIGAMPFGDFRRGGSSFLYLLLDGIVDGHLLIRIYSSAVY